jgi:1-acyl-sn-glycerol-3-phosphate acyltransferase
MFRFLSVFFFRLLGWKIVGSFPPELKKYVVAVAPHTSNWDFLVGIAARSILKMKNTKFLGKSSLFRPPFGWLFRSLGGYPVDRSHKHDMVEQVAALIKSKEQFILGIAPEGTRKKVDKFRTGFYYIAKAAEIPIIPVGFDFSRKEVVLGQPLYPSDFDNDMVVLKQFYSGILGKNPEWGIN